MEHVWNFVYILTITLGRIITIYRIYSTSYHICSSLTKTKISLFLLGHLREGSEGEGALNLADVVLENSVWREGLSEVEAVLNLE